MSHTFKDKDGNFLIGIQVTILGVTYLTNDKGTVSFTMFFPGDDRYVEFVGEEPVGFKAPEDFDPIVKGEFEIKGKTTVPASADANDPPGGIVFKVDAGTGELLSSATLSMGQSVKLWAVYWDPNSADAGQLVATWVLDGGTMVSGADPAPSWLSGLLPAFSANAKVAGIAWTAPQEARFCGVTFEAFDPKGLSVIRTVGLPVGAPPPTVNLPPSGYVLGPVRVPAGQQVSFTVIASDPNRDILNFAWSSSGGSFSSPKNDVTTWTAPLSTGFATITCTISDQDSLSFSTQQLVEVVPYVSGTIITDNGKIAGHLIDDYSNLAVDGALVGIVGSETFTVSDSSGYFEISGLTPGAYDLYVQRDGYLVANFYGIVVLK